MAPGWRPVMRWPIPGDTPELLGVEMDQLTGAFALVMHDCRLLLECGQPVQAQLRSTPPTVDTACRVGGRSAVRSSPGAATVRSRSPARWGCSAGTGVGAELRSSNPAAPSLRYRQPTIALPRRYPGGLRRLYDAPARLCNALDQQESTPAVARAGSCGVNRAFLWMFIRGSGLGCR